MPSMKTLIDEDIKFAQKIFNRQEKVRKLAHLLPDDFTGAVFLKAKARGKAIKARLAEIDQEIEQVAAGIADLRRQQQAASPLIVRGGGVKGDILDDYQIIKPTPQAARGERLKTKKACVLSQEINTHFRLQRRLQTEKSILTSELSDMRKVALLATRGDIALITFLAQMVNQRVEWGLSLLTTDLPPIAKQMLHPIVVVDSSGFELDDVPTGEPVIGPIQRI